MMLVIQAPIPRRSRDSGISTQGNFCKVAYESTKGSQRRGTERQATQREKANCGAGGGTFVVDPRRVEVGLRVLVQCLDIVGLVDGSEFGHGRVV